MSNEKLNAIYLVSMNRIDSAIAQLQKDKELLQSLMVNQNTTAISIKPSGVEYNEPYMPADVNEVLEDEVKITEDDVGFGDMFNSLESVLPEQAQDANFSDEVKADNE